MAKERYELPNKNKMRNLAQFKSMTDAEFEEWWSKKYGGNEPSDLLEKRIELKLAEFENDYDLSDLKVNDRLVLRALIQAIINLEDLEQASYQTRENGYSPDIMAMMRDMQTMSDTLRKSISSMQEDLRITRKLRKGDKEQTVVSYLEDLKLKAKKFVESRMFYVFCPDCHMLLSTTWFLYPENKNKLILTCGRTLDNGEKCPGKVEITSKELLETRGSNKEDIPEALK